MQGRKLNQAFMVFLSVSTRHHLWVTLIRAITTCTEHLFSRTVQFGLPGQCRVEVVRLQQI